MTELLHHTDVFTSLAATPPGLARDWANARLALFQPDRVLYLPEEPMSADVVIASKPKHLVELISRTLRDATTIGEELASALTAISSYGVMPEDTTELRNSIRDAIHKATPVAVPWLSLAMALCGEHTAANIKHVSSIHTAESEWILPVLLCWYASENEGIDFNEIAAALLPKIKNNPHLLPAILETLGTPASSAFVNQFETLQDALGAGTTWAGARFRKTNIGKGSAKSQFIKAVTSLLRDKTDPASRLLVALFQHREAAQIGLGAAAVASWIHAYQPGNPIFDTLNCAAGSNNHALSRARSLVDNTHTDEVRVSLERQQPVEASLLALELLTPDSLELRRQLAARIKHPERSQLRAEVAAIIAYRGQPNEIVQLLADENWIDAGLCLARWCPHIQVLQALLELETPADDARKDRFALALAAMGDHAALTRIHKLDLPDGHIRAWCHNLSLDLLGTTR